MSADSTVKSMTNQQVATAASMYMPALECMFSTLRTQSEYLRRVEQLTTEMLQRRRAGCDAMQHLLTQLGGARDVSDVFQAEQTWLSGAIQRVIADASSLQTLAIEDVQRFAIPALETALAPTTYLPAQLNGSRMAAE
jgi:hypothetical protein